MLSLFVQKQHFVLPIDFIYSLFYTTPTQVKNTLEEVSIIAKLSNQETSSCKYRKWVSISNLVKTNGLWFQPSLATFLLCIGRIYGKEQKQASALLGKVSKVGCHSEIWNQATQTHTNIFVFLKLHPRLLVRIQVNCFWFLLILDLLACAFVFLTFFFCLFVFIIIFFL